MSLQRHSRRIMERQIPEGYTVWIEHHRDSSRIIDARPERKNGKPLTPIQAVTIAELKDPDGNVVARGYAYTSISDQFSKRRGRLAATGRALKKFESNT